MPTVEASIAGIPAFRSKSYDIVIIGAGPAGSSAAHAGARRGAEVLLIDRKQRIGEPVRCGEFVPQWISRHVCFSSGCVRQTVEMLVTHLPDGLSCEMRGPGYMLDRSRLDKELAASAVSSGAKLLTGTKAVGLSSGGVMIDHGPEREIVEAKVIIGADGVQSDVGRWLGLPPMKTVMALQYEVVHFSPQRHVDIYFHTDYEGGYGWFFPKGRTANVGIAIVPQKASLLPNLMNDFLDLIADTKKMPRIDVIGKTGGSIPCGEPSQTVFGNVLLVGDAASHAHPISGAGILNAVIGGEIAGRTAAEAVKIQDLRYLEKYETEWREAFGKSISYGALKRRFLEENWNRSGAHFEDLVRKTWIGFKEYHEDRKKKSPDNIHI